MQGRLPGGEPEQFSYFLCLFVFFVAILHFHLEGTP
jgi:hypothetical protein